MDDISLRNDILFRRELLKKLDALVKAIEDLKPPEYFPTCNCPSLPHGTGPKPCPVHN